MSLDSSSQVAIIVAGIAATGSIFAAIIKGIFSIVHKRKEGKGSKYIVNQIGYDNVTQIGVQFDNKKSDE